MWSRVLCFSHLLLLDLFKMPPVHHPSRSSIRGHRASKSWTQTKAGSSKLIVTNQPIHMISTMSTHNASVHPAPGSFEDLLDHIPCKPPTSSWSLFLCCYFLLSGMIYAPDVRTTIAYVRVGWTFNLQTGLFCLLCRLDQPGLDNLKLVMIRQLDFFLLKCTDYVIPNA